MRSARAPCSPAGTRSAFPPTVTASCRPTRRIVHPSTPRSSTSWEGCESLVTAFGFANAEGGGYEADDFLAAAARLECEAGGTALVVTSDRDAYQLVSASVTVLAPQTGGRPPARIG